MKWFIKCFKQYTDFNSRARRSEFWWFSLINFIITIILFICWIIPVVKMGIDAGEIDDMELVRITLGSPFLYLYLIYYIAVLIPSIAVTVRRLHDIGRSGFWYFLFLGGSLLGSIGSMLQETNIGLTIFFYCANLAICIILLVWMFTDSQYGENKWGPNPKGEGNQNEATTTEQ
jgi:uncharacterized membrane protein YhaH (DUF805 family)